MDIKQSKWPKINKFGKLNVKNYLATVGLIIAIYFALYLPIAEDGIIS